ncbi:predicted protein [Brucella pinnipedialis M292/94/1]|uniref:Uncharacterized protein n=6 Tax=Brucella TaxID=234 RepID=A0A0E1WZJ0_9HYPH|nr:predicted protein [Brucella pinnipedialis M292/94/1]
MYNAPDVAKDRIISVRQIVEALGQYHHFPQRLVPPPRAKRIVNAVRAMETGVGKAPLGFLYPKRPILSPRFNKTNCRIMIS